jgi:2-polyprenyl-3-methyl-5-hydroxy-6-metoxy-1,4-benzoquinol methylase
MTDTLSTEQRMSREAYRWVEQGCPICEAPPTRRIGRRGGIAHRTNLGVECEVWQCERCSLVFPNPMPIPVGGLDQHYSLLPDDYFHNHDIDFKAIGSQHRLHVAEELTGGKGRVLDIGAGRGELLRAALEGGWDAVGIEPSTQFAEYAAKHSGVLIKREPVEHCGFAAGSFDVVVLGAVLEHLYNPDETIKEVARILRTGGALFVDVPNEAGLYFRVGNFYQKLRQRDWVVNVAPTFSPYHIFGFSPRSLKALLAKHHLEPANWRIYGGRAMVPSRSGTIGALERLAARAVTAASNLGSLGTYIETWAIKS